MLNLPTVNYIMDHEWHCDKRVRQEDIAFLEEQINEFNIATTGVPFGGYISCLVRDKSNTLIGGIHGWVWGNCCEVQSLWVRQEHRNQGIGARLVNFAEQEARTRGCTIMALSTHSFQAPKFYQKLGFEFVGVVESYPEPHHKYFLRKQLNEEAA